MSEKISYKLGKVTQTEGEPRCTTALRKPEQARPLKGAPTISRFTKYRVTQLLEESRPASPGHRGWRPGDHTAPQRGVCPSPTPHPRHYMWRLHAGPTGCVTLGWAALGAAEGQSSEFLKHRDDHEPRREPHQHKGHHCGGPSARSPGHTRRALQCVSWGADLWSQVCGGPQAPSYSPGCASAPARSG